MSSNCDSSIVHGDWSNNHSEASNKHVKHRDSTNTNVLFTKETGELTGANGLMQTKHAHTHTGVQVGFNVSPS